MEVKCALCNKTFNIKKYLIKDRNYCCGEHYHQYMKEIYDKKHTIKCDNCGKEYVYRGGINHYNRFKHHYCSCKCLAEGNRIYLEYHNNSNKRYKIWCSAKKRAKAKGLDFNIELEDIPEIPKYCPVLGIEIKSNTTNAPLDSSPSLDRIDSSKGYIKGNVRIISNRANRIKADATVGELRKVLEDYERIQNSN